MIVKFRKYKWRHIWGLDKTEIERFYLAMNLTEYRNYKEVIVKQYLRTL